jgi:hypothetical protein
MVFNEVFLWSQAANSPLKHQLPFLPTARSFKSSTTQNELKSNHITQTDINNSIKSYYDNWKSTQVRNFIGDPLPYVEIGSHF